jgi:KDO2-lipid IV(A) lauroyltransferase
VDFFGSPTRLPDGAVRVALRTSSPLIPAFARRLPDNSFLVQVEPPLELPQTGDEEADMATGMRMVAATMERHIAQHPEQWLVAQPIWPAG